MTLSVLRPEEVSRFAELSKEIRDSSVKEGVINAINHKLFLNYLDGESSVELLSLENITIEIREEGLINWVCQFPGGFPNRFQSDIINLIKSFLGFEPNSNLYREQKSMRTLFDDDEDGIGQAVERFRNHGWILELETCTLSEDPTVESTSTSPRRNTDGTIRGSSEIENEFFRRDN